MKNRSMKQLLMAGWFMLLTLSASAQTAQPSLRSIAVMEFEAKGVTPLEASTLTDRFRSELVQTKAFIQIERSRIEQIFKEQKLQMTGTVSDDQLVQIGELLGAELLVVGSIGKLGSTYTIDLRLVDVQSGEIIASYFKDYRGAVDGLLGQFRIIAGEIAGVGNQTASTSEAHATELVSNTTTTTVGFDLVTIQQQARTDANADYSKLAWGAGGAVGGSAGGCLLGAVGGLAGAGAAAGAGYLVDAKPSPQRLENLENSDALIQQTYIQAYEEQLKKNRATWGAGGGLLGCCAGSLLAGLILASTASY